MLFDYKKSDHDEYKLLCARYNGIVKGNNIFKKFHWNKILKQGNAKHTTVRIFTRGIDVITPVREGAADILKLILDILKDINLSRDYINDSGCLDT